MQVYKIDKVWRIITYVLTPVAMIPFGVLLLFPIIPDFNFDINKDLNILEPQKNLQDYLKPWKVLNLIPRSQSDLNKIVLQTFFSLKRLCCINILQDTDF